VGVKGMAILDLESRLKEATALGGELKASCVQALGPVKHGAHEQQQEDADNDHDTGRHVALLQNT
jgi:hypothetical protein